MKASIKITQYFFYFVYLCMVSCNQSEQGIHRARQPTPLPEGYKQQYEFFWILN